jgi:hypothetical protein
MELKQVEIPKHHKSPLSSPLGFSPLTARNEELVKYGFSKCPNKSTHPRLRAVWEKAMSRPARHIYVELELLKGPIPFYIGSKVV